MGNYSREQNRLNGPQRIKPIKPETEYEKTARLFLEKYGIKFEYKKGDKQSEWQPSGQYYWVTLSQCSKHVAFDFWGSKHDLDNGFEITPYDVLACISSDLYCAEEFNDFCADFGYDTDSRKALKLFTRCASFAAQLQAFFTPEQQTEL